MQAFCLIRQQPWYRRESFVAGLRAAGHSVLTQQPVKPDKNTLLVIWNRYAEMHELALRVERAGGRVLVAENGYVGHGGGTPKFQVHPAGPQPGHYYALAEGYHNGGGTWRDGDDDRWGRLDVQLAPWREGGDYLLVCPNRSFGVPGRAMPTDWAEKTAASLKKSAKLPVRVRVHPGNDAPKRALAEDLAGAAAVFIWSSSCGVHALAAGIPVFCAAPYWILKGAAFSGFATKWDYPDRLPHFRRMAWAQWTCEEIASGKPFRHLLGTAS